MLNYSQHVVFSGKENSNKQLNDVGMIKFAILLSLNSFIMKIPSIECHCKNDSLRLEELVIELDYKHSLFFIL